MCIVVGQKDSHHREVVLPDICLRRGLYQLIFSMQPATNAPFYENPSRFYYFNSKEADFTLSVPQPFRNAASWKPKHFQPVMSDCADEKASALYYGLYSPHRARSIATIYQRPPSDWTETTHPCLGEPKEGSELWRVSKLLYGVESVSRLNYSSHPLSDDRFHLFIATDPVSLFVPVFSRNEDPDLLDTIICQMLRPFWSEASGRILCPVCLLEVINDKFSPVLLTRSEFLKHWVLHHLSSFVAACTFSAARRMTMSLGPPGGKGSTTRTGLSGQV
jgi:hypothetical protein